MRSPLVLMLSLLVCSALRSVGASSEALPDHPFPKKIAAWTQQDMLKQRQAAVVLNKNILAAIGRGEKAFTIPPGEYRFHPDALPNLKLKGVHDFTINAKGATFWLYPFQRVDGVYLEACSNVTIKGLTVDYYPTTYPQGMVSKVDPEAGYLDFKVDRGYSTPFDVETHLVGAKLVYYETSGKMIPFLMDWVKEIQDLGDGNYRVFSKKGGWTYKKFKGVVAGTKVVLAGRTLRMAFNLKDSSRCTLENITIYASPHMVFTEHFGEGGHTYRGCKVIRRPGTNRLLACNADVFHSIGVTTGPVIDGCELSHAADDLINIHGLISMVHVQSGDNTVEMLCQMNRDFPPGTTLGFYDFNTMRLKAEAKVVECSPVDDAEQVKLAQGMIDVKQLAFLKPGLVARVKLDRAVKVDPFDFVGDDVRVAKGTIIRNSYFHDGFARGVLLKCRGGLIEGNRVEDMGISSIGVSIDPHFMEGPFPQNITIRGNRILRNGYTDLLSTDSWNYLIGAISVTTECKTGLPESPTSRQIVVTDNVITDSMNCGIFYSNVAGGTIANNRIVGALSRDPQKMGGRMQVAPAAYAILIGNSNKIKVEENSISNSGSHCLGPVGFFGTVEEVGPQKPEAAKQ